MRVTWKTGCALVALCLPFSAMAQTTGRADSAIAGGSVRTTPGAVSQNITKPLSEHDRGQAVIKARALNFRLEQLQHAKDDLAAVEATYKRLELRAQNPKLSDADRAKAQKGLASYANIVNIARAQAREEFQTKQEVARIDTTLARNDQLLAVEAKRIEPVEKRGRLVNRPSPLRYGAPQNFPTEPMAPEDRARYEQRFAQWKARVKELEARRPDEIIRRAEATKLDMGNHLYSHVLQPEQRISYNAQIRALQDIIDQKQVESDALWDARRTVFDLDNELRYDTTRQIRQESGGIFSDPRHREAMNRFMFGTETPGAGPTRLAPAKTVTTGTRIPGKSVKIQ